jgi:hypothetical protein
VDDAPAVLPDFAIAQPDFAVVLPEVVPAKGALPPALWTAPEVGMAPEPRNAQPPAAGAFKML